MMIPFGGQVGTIVNVGKAMGEMNSKKARTMIKIAVLFMLVVDAMLAFAIIIWKDFIAHIFTSNPAIVAYLDECFNAVAFLMIFFGIHVIEAGALRGLGLQMHATLTVLIC